MRLAHGQPSAQNAACREQQGTAHGGALRCSPCTSSHLCRPQCWRTTAGITSRPGISTCSLPVSCGQSVSRTPLASDALPEIRRLQRCVLSGDRDRHQSPCKIPPQDAAALSETRLPTRRRSRTLSVRTCSCLLRVIFLDSLCLRLALRRRPGPWPARPPALGSPTTLQATADAARDVEKPRKSLRASPPCRACSLRSWRAWRGAAPQMSDNLGCPLSRASCACDPQCRYHSEAVELTASSQARSPPCCILLFPFAINGAAGIAKTAPRQPQSGRHDSAPRGEMDQNTTASDTGAAGPVPHRSLTSPRACIVYLDRIASSHPQIRATLRQIRTTRCGPVAAFPSQRKRAGGQSPPLHRAGLGRRWIIRAVPGRRLGGVMPKYDAAFSSTRCAMRIRVRPMWSRGRACDGHSSQDDPRGHLGLLVAGTGHGQLSAKLGGAPELVDPQGTDRCRALKTPCSDGFGTVCRASDAQQGESAPISLSDGVVGLATHHYSRSFPLMVCGAQQFNELTVPRNRNGTRQSQGTTDLAR